MPWATPPSICPAASTGLMTLPDFLDGDEVVDARLAGRRVDRHLGDVHGPGVGAVRVALIRLVVPPQAGRRLVAARWHAADRRSRGVVGARTAERLGRRRRPQAGRPGRARRAALTAADLHQLADDHARARRDGRPAVRHDGRVRLHDLDRGRAARRARPRRSARRSCWCPGRSRCWPRAPGPGRRRSPRSRRRTRRCSSPDPVKPAPCMNVARPMPFRTVQRRVDRGEALALRVVVGDRQRAIEQRGHVDRLADHLADGARLPGADEIAAAQLVRASDRRRPRRDPCGARARTCSAARRSRETRRAAACWSRRRGR